MKKIQIESRVMGDLAKNHIIPTAIKYQNTLIENVKGLKAVLSESEYKNASAEQLVMIRQISEHISAIKKGVDDMIKERSRSNEIEDMRAKAVAYCDQVKPYFESIREHVDHLEMMVDDENWPLPKYRELLFTN